jgi:hypothetical protein
MMLNRFLGAISRFTCLALCAAAMLWASPASALSYRLVDANFPGCKGECPKVIVASGTISQNEHIQLLAFLEQSLGRGKVAQILVIESPGGFTAGGLALGYALRKLKMSVIVGRWTGEALRHLRLGLRVRTGRWHLAIFRVGQPRRRASRPYRHGGAGPDHAASGQCDG